MISPSTPGEVAAGLRATPNQAPTRIAITASGMSNRAFRELSTGASPCRRARPYPSLVRIATHWPVVTGRPHGFFGQSSGDARPGVVLVRQWALSRRVERRVAAAWGPALTVYPGPTTRGGVVSLHTTS